MASPQKFIFAIYDPATGAPMTGHAGSMSFDTYKDVNGNNLAQPAIVEVGGGLYSFSPSLVPGQIIGYILNTGSAKPERLSGWLRPEDFGADNGIASPAVIVFAVFDGAGVPKTGVACTFSAYKDDLGNNLTAPSIVELGGGLYYFTPTFTSGRDACYIIDTASNTPLHIANYLRIEDFQTTPAPLSAYAVNPTSTASSSSVDLGTDVYDITDLGVTDFIVSGTQALAQRLARRLMTPRGALANIGEDPDFGWDVRQYVNAKIGPNEITAAQAAIEKECLKDEEVEAVAATLTFNPGTHSLTINLQVTASNGPFTLVLNVNSLTVDILVNA